MNPQTNLYPQKITLNVWLVLTVYYEHLELGETINSIKYVLISGCVKSNVGIFSKLKSVYLKAEN